MWDKFFLLGKLTTTKKVNDQLFCFKINVFLANFFFF